MAGLHRSNLRVLKDFVAHATRTAMASNELPIMDWEACFFSQTAHYVGFEYAPIDVLLAFLERQHSDGFVSQTLLPTGDWQGLHCKPFLAQTLQYALVHAPIDTEETSRLIRLIDGYLEFFQSRRLHDSGLYFWASAAESGISSNIDLLHLTAEQAENNYREITRTPQLLPVDLNSYLVREYRAFADVLDRFNISTRAKQYRSRAQRLCELIEQHLWSPTLEMYANFNAESGELVTMRSWTGLLPVMLGFARRDRTEIVLTQNLLNESRFLGPTGLASLARSEDFYHQASMSNARNVQQANWWGPMWVLPNVLACRALMDLGRNRDARMIASRVLSTIVDDVDQNGTLHANYDAETGKPLSLPGFLAWNALVLELVDVYDADSWAAA